MTYSATKTFVAEYTRTLRYELRRFGVGVTTLYPGTTRTHFFEAAGVKVLGPQADSMADPADVARKAVAAMLRKRRTVTPGATPKLTRLAGKILPRGAVYSALRAWRAKREARND
jgi:short-subunit dehydrogenase